ncbi:peptidase M28 [Mycobacterium sp. MS1601]|uniref:M28 family peptidase n=1 Tax=Mycobacterium sp. MS1601 TaxID=1936029 RepID=UPI0009794F26|nr:M28 family peptidase [Mycobacterium sp. MS1601]AQA03840.1 peptidase M28 [Mycobacterium sp. MS1601]
MRVRRVAAGVLSVLVLAGCSSQPAPPAPEPVVNLADHLAEQVTEAGMAVHLQRLQDIADEFGGNRADGTPGFDASVDYVVKMLQDKGFDVEITEFERLENRSPGRPTVTVGGRAFQVDQASLLLQTPGVNGPVVKPTRSPGCAAADYPTQVPRGGIAVVDDTACSVVAKQKAAAAKGAAALVVVSAGGRNGSPPGLFERNYYEQLTLPVAIIGDEGGAALRRATGPARVVLDGRTVKLTSRNVVAQTKTGSASDVVMVGAHLDSVPEGPGINDNGTGVAAVLETALRLGAEPDITNAVRFAFWGAEEKRLAGSIDYVFGLSRDELNDIALYLNFDMIGSPNAGYFTYDGDQSGTPSPDFSADDVPIGSDGVERTLAGYLNLAGMRPADMPLAANTDYSPFISAGIPVGGMTTGGPQQKTTVQARLWGGRAGVPFDPNYHSNRDTARAVNRDALAIMGAGVAFAVGTYASSIEGPNGVPAHPLRHRSAMGP